MTDNPWQFEKLSIDPNRELNLILNCEQNVIDILKEIKNKKQINEDLYNRLHPVGRKSGVLFSLAKVHEKVNDGSPFFDPFFQRLGHSSIRQLSFLFLYLKS